MPQCKTAWQVKKAGIFIETVSASAKAVCSAALAQKTEPTTRKEKDPRAGSRSQSRKDGNANWDGCKADLNRV